MKSIGQSIFLRGIFLRPASLVFVLGVFGASALAQMTKHASAGPGASHFALTKKQDGGKPQLAAGAGTSVPVAAQPGISAVLGRDDSGYQVRAMGRGFRAENPRQGLTTEFTRRGIEVRSGTVRWGLALQGYGYGNALLPVGPAAPQGSANRVEYRRGALTEWYVNGPLGMEQGFTLAARPAENSGQPLTIALGLSKELSASVDPGGKGATLTQRDGQAKLRYAGLVVYDATGRELRSWMEARDNDLLLRVEDAGAPYPLVVDPFIQLAKLTASGEVASDNFGLSVAVSSDGSTLAVGTPRDAIGSGAVFVFERPAGGWATTAKFAAKLSASDAALGDGVGSSVGLSSDGGTVMAGAPNATVGSNANQGAVYVFLKPASGWATTLNFNAKLTASDGAKDDQLGYAVAVSSDGGTLVAGGPYATVGSNSSQGAAYVFVKPTTGWATSANFTAKLTASDGIQFADLGWSVAISGDGGTLVVGAIGAGPNYAQGAAYVFAKPTSGWATTANFTAELTASDGSQYTNFGDSIAINGDGSTVVAGAPVSGSFVGPVGAAYVFVKPTGGWVTSSTFATKATNGGEWQECFGCSVAVSGDGGTVLVGAPGICYSGSCIQGETFVLTKPSGGWTTPASFDATLAASDGGQGDTFGHVAISSDGGTLVVGAPDPLVNNLSTQGAVYVFASNGSGVPTASPSTTSLSFGNQDVKTTSAAQTVTLTNTGSAALQVTGVTASSDFATTTKCLTASPLQPGASCTESITFTPLVAGPASGTLTFTDNSGNAVGGTQTVSLSGTGLDFIVSAGPASQSVLPGHSVKYTITLTPLDGFTGTVTVKCSGAPTGSTCKLSPSPVTLSGTATTVATVTVPRTARKQTRTLTFTATSGPLVHTATATLVVN